MEQHTDAMVAPPAGFSLKWFFNTSAALLSHPRLFFLKLADSDIQWRRPAAFFIFTALLFSGASLLATHPVSAVSATAIFFINAVGMALFAFLVGYIIVKAGLGRPDALPRLFGVYAFSCGITLLLAWVPFSAWFTEPWKWWLIFTGLTRACGFRAWEALLVVAISIAVIVLFFSSLIAAVA